MPRRRPLHRRRRRETAVARDIARVLGASQRGDGFLQGNGYVVTWAIGHLVNLPQPHEVNADWRKWRRDHLPMLPRDWPLVVSEDTKDQFEAVRRILTDPRRRAHRLRHGRRAARAS